MPAFAAVHKTRGATQIVESTRCGDQAVQKACISRMQTKDCWVTDQECHWANGCTRHPCNFNLYLQPFTGPPSGTNLPSDVSTASVNLTPGTSNYTGLTLRPYSSLSGSRFLHGIASLHHQQTSQPMSGHMWWPTFRTRAKALPGMVQTWTGDLQRSLLAKVASYSLRLRHVS